MANDSTASDTITVSQIMELAKELERIPHGPAVVLPHTAHYHPTIQLKKFWWMSDEFHEEYQGWLTKTFGEQLSFWAMDGAVLHGFNTYWREGEDHG